MSNLNLKTGDILLFDYNEKGILGIFNKAIKYFTNSDYSHVAVVLKDPEFIHPSLKGYYIWESSYEGTPDPQDGKIKLGVQVTPLDEVLNNCKETNSSVFLRRVNCPSYTFNYTNLKEVHDVVYDKPYDIVPMDWINALSRKDTEPQKTDRFWCSALVGYIYTRCNLLVQNTDWSMLRPSDFSDNSDSILHWMNPCFLDKEVRII
tara:strand:- start:615 stop:1229 length:615 start_codon:yes stop_codon:yes gene_type:complete